MSEAVEIPRKQVYQISDIFTRIDELLEAILVKFNELSGKITVTGRHLIMPINDSVGTTQKEIFDGDTDIYSILINNTHATQTLYVSFDGGSLFKDISPQDTLSLSAQTNKTLYLEHKIKVKGSGSNTTFQMLILK